MSQTYDIGIRGGGIVGCTLALHLAAKRLRVALHAPTLHRDEQGGDVRAYALNQSSRQLLDAIRCWPGELAATPVLRMQVHGDQGGAIQFDAAMQGVPALNWIVDVPALEAKLREAIGYQPLITLVDEPAPAELTVVCEGRASQTRAELSVEFDTHPYQQYAVATRVRSVTPHQRIAHQWFQHSGNDSAIAGFLPMGGRDSGDWAVVWSVSATQQQQLLALSDDEFCQQLAAVTEGELGPFTLLAPRQTWMLQHACAQRWSGRAAWGSWVLAGDAAHNVHPLAGQGLNLGLGDATELIARIAHRDYWRAVSDPKVLRAYERARKADFALVGGTGDALQRLFAHPHTAVQQLRNRGMSLMNASGFAKHWLAQQAMHTHG
ncbi:FAD-dependent monooxygenase [Curvibacter sp. CHRR-16]|uniref:FAD-dependent monooxygenase n=1 Tax=Curvibacter sp. CHRR-16 TaxID=2835872 RepID=UPI001BD9D1B0|nr:FAD-dependent monooxygenase [Curvibacter sp. CHRR-16]MBT0570985.1 FAD-dependent monooxygenase [Curvibacter sp. CHRR-16]